MSVLAAWRPRLYHACFPAVLLSVSSTCMNPELLSRRALSVRLGVFGTDCEHDHSG